MGEEKQEQWAIVDLFGHQRLAGLISEHELGGSSFVRLDVPECGDTPGFTRLFGNAAIYSISFVTEDIARQVAGYVRARPVQPFEMKQLPSNPVDYTRTRSAYQDDEMDEDQAG